MRKTYKRIIASMLALSFVVPIFAQAAYLSGDVENGFTITHEDGTVETVDDSWQEEYPYGVIALNNSQYTVQEGGDEITIDVHRLGGTTGAVSAIIQYNPAISENEDGTFSYDNAVSADDIQILVEDPLPISEYQAWGMDAPAENTDISIYSEIGQDGDGVETTILKFDAENASSIKWYAREISETEDMWTEIELSDSVELPVGDEELSIYDFRAEFVIDDVRYMTNSFLGSLYVKEDVEEPTPAPDDIILNPDPTYSPLVLEEDGDKFKSWLFEVKFAEGEYIKQIKISATDDSLAEIDEFALFTISETVGGDVLDSLSTASLHVVDNDEELFETSEIGFEVTEASFDKSDLTAEVTITRTGGLLIPLAVEWSTVDGTALAGTDFVSASGEVMFYANETSKTIEIELINDQVESEELLDFTVVLSNLKGDDDSTISNDTFTAKLYNTNTAEELNLPSIITNVNATDVSTQVVEQDNETVVANDVLTGTQNEAPEMASLDHSAQSMARSNLAAGQFNIDIYASNSSTTTNSLSLSNSDGGDYVSRGFSAREFYRIEMSGTGVAGFTDNFWYPNSYAYNRIYAHTSSNHQLFYDDSDPNLDKGVFSSTLYWSRSVSGSASFGYNTGYVYAYHELKQEGGGNGKDTNLSASVSIIARRRTIDQDIIGRVFTANNAGVAPAGATVISDTVLNSIDPTISYASGSVGGSGYRPYQGTQYSLSKGDAPGGFSLARVRGEISGTSNGELFDSYISNSYTTPQIFVDPAHSGDIYFDFIYERTQAVTIDVSTSAERDSTGAVIDTSYNSALNLLKEKSTTDTITIKYSTIEEDVYPYFSRDLSTTNVSISGSLSDGKFNLNTGTIKNIQSINFNLSENDYITLNGRMFKGNEEIWLDQSDYAIQTLVFGFYEESFASSENPMKATIDRVEIYFDTNGNGKIDGTYNRNLGIFQGEGDELVLEFSTKDGDLSYAENDFVPVYENGVLKQYFIRTYYTANPVTLIPKPPQDVDERMQIMPAAITSITESSVYSTLTDEQKAYRIFESGITNIIGRDGTTVVKDNDYTADNQYKYTAEATSYNYIDMPMGGDINPPEKATPADVSINSSISGKQIGSDGYAYKYLNGTVYYYKEGASKDIGSEVYIWEPDFDGNLLYKFDDPELVFIANSVAGPDTPVTTEFTSSKGTETNILGELQDIYALTPDGIEDMNNYLGSFNGDDTYSLMVKEQTLTTDEIKVQESATTFSTRNGSDNTKDNNETISKAQFGLIPNTEYLTQMESTANGTGTADSGDNVEYPEFGMDVAPNLYAFDSELLGATGVTLDGDEILISIGLPVYASDSSGDTAGSSVNSLDDIKDTAGKVRDFVNAVKNKQQKPFNNLLSDDELSPSKATSKSFEFVITVSAAISLKYSKLDNTFKFSEATLFATFGVEFRLQYRFTPVPIVYVYVQLSGSATIGIGLGQDRYAETTTVFSNSNGKYIPSAANSLADKQEIVSISSEAEKPGVSLKFDGAFYFEAFEFTDSNNNNTFDTGEKATLLSDVQPGLITSDGEQNVEIMIDEAKGKDVVVLLTATQDTTLYESAAITDVKGDFYFSGISLEFEGAVEAGAGVGIEIAKFEIFVRVSIGVGMSFLEHGKENEGVSEFTFDSFDFAAAIGFRVLFLFFSYEQELIAYNAGYENGEGWSHSWSALGGQFGGEITRSYMLENDETVKITPPAEIIANSYANDVNVGESPISTFAVDIDGLDEFQVSGYGESVDASKILDNTATGYDYQIITVTNAADQEENYVVYTGTRTNPTRSIDVTELKLQKLQENGTEYGLVSPISNNSGTDAISLDNDTTGDVEFTAWEGEDGIIHAVWVSYVANAADDSSDVTTADDAATKTTVKYATFDTRNPDATGFTAPVELTSTVGRYDFMPKSSGDVAVFAESVPYTAEEVAAKVAEYDTYLTNTTQVFSNVNTDGENAITQEEYNKVTNDYRSAYQSSLYNIYGKNSMITVAPINGVALTNSQMYVSHHQEDGDDVAENITNEIITNLQITDIDDTYYLAYTTQQEVLNAEKTELSLITRMYLRTFTITTTESESTVVWGEPYLLRTVVDNEQDSSKDGVYDSSATTISGKAYPDPYISELKFLEADLGNSLTGGSTESFSPFSLSPNAEKFLIFALNGNTYVINEESLESITTSKTGTIYPFFTFEQAYDNIDETQDAEPVSSGKFEVQIGSDGDGNIVAIYTSPVESSLQNAIYISYWDSSLGAWGDGVMLAMRDMSVYENIIAQGLSQAEAEELYLNQADLQQFMFSNLQFAAGKSSSATTISTFSMSETSSETNVFGKMIAENPETLEVLEKIPTTYSAEGTALNPEQGYALLQELESRGIDTQADTAVNTELLILTQGSLTQLAKYDENGDVITNGDAYVVGPRVDGEGYPLDSTVGIYAISYSKGNQRVGNISIDFAYDEFTVDSKLIPSVSFKNVGDAAIRRDTNADGDILVELMLHQDGTSNVFTSWNVASNIASGQSVELSADTPITLSSSLGENDYFYIRVSESEDYFGENAYKFDSSNGVGGENFKYNINSTSEMAIENSAFMLTGITNGGKSTIDMSFDVTNRGKAKAEDVFVQFSYDTGEVTSDDVKIFAPLNITDSEIYVSQEKYISSNMRSFPANDDLANGIIRLDTDDTYYTRDYYITEAYYNELISKYYSTTAVSGWRSESFRGQTYWFDSSFYISAFDAYTAGQEALEMWTKSGSYYYNNENYSSLSEAQSASNAARKREYILTTSEYSMLSDIEKLNWHSVDGSYIKLGYSTLAEAESAYQTALDNDDATIASNYYRNVDGIINVTPDMFNGEITDSLDIKVEVFTKSSNASIENNLYISSHEDEYYGIDNSVIEVIEHETFINTPSKIILAEGTTYRLPIKVSTSRENAPNITVIETVDESDEIVTLYFEQSADTDGVSNTISGNLVINARQTGAGVIQVVDEATNTSHPLAYEIVEEGDGINIYNDNDMFTFYNKTNDEYSALEDNQLWSFQAASSWGLGEDIPYLGNLARGEQGSSFSFDTTATTVSFEMLGNARVTSNRFNVVKNISSTDTITSTTSNTTFQTENVNFYNTTGAIHTVTVTVTSDEAFFDTVKQVYEEYTPPEDDADAPTIFLSRSLPKTNSLANDSEVTLTVYAIDETGLNQLTVNGETISVTESTTEEFGASLLQMEVTLTKDSGALTISSRDTNGNTSNRQYPIDWFGDSTTDSVPSLETATISKVLKDDTVEVADIYATETTYTANDAALEKRLVFSELTIDDATLDYSKFSSDSNSFATVTDVSENGYYMVKATNNTDDTIWSQKIMYVGIFDAAIPRISATSEIVVNPNMGIITWFASLSETSVATIDNVMMNGIELLPDSEPKTNSQNGEYEVKYGGNYAFKVIDSKDIEAFSNADITLPIDISSEGVFTVINPWGQAGSENITDGSIIIDFSKIHGADYLTNVDGSSNPLPIEDYKASYEYTYFDVSDYADKILPGSDEFASSDKSWLDGLTWTEANNIDEVSINELETKVDAETVYVVIIRDKQNPTEYETMASAKITLSDNAIDLDSIIVKFASTEDSNDGSINVEVSGGPYEMYEYAILKLAENSDGTYDALDADAFKHPEVIWELSSAISSDLNKNVFENLDKAGYQIAVRTYANETDTINDIAALQALMDSVNTSKDALNVLISANTTLINEESSEISSNHQNYIDSNTALNEAQTEYDELKSRVDRGDTTITQEDLDELSAIVEAITADFDATKLAFETSITSLSEADKTAILELSDKILADTSGNTAYLVADLNVLIKTSVATYQNSLSNADITTAENEFNSKVSDYETKVAELSEKSKTAYVNNSSLWNSVLTNQSLLSVIGTGISTEIVEIYTTTSSAYQPDGTITVTADKGSSYNGLDDIYYQFAIYPIESEEKMLDFSADMTEIHNLSLDWKFADDILNEPNVCTFENIAVGYYQVFVRVVQDSDLSDDFDVATKLVDASGQTEDLASLQKDLADAKLELEQAETRALEIHAIYEEYEQSKDNAKYQEYLAAINSDAEVLSKLQDYLSAESKDISSTFAAYKTELTRYVTELAEQSIFNATGAFNNLSSEISEEIENAYAANKLHYNTVSYGLANVRETVRIRHEDEVVEIISSDNEVTFVITGDITKEDAEKILESNKDSSITIITPDRTIIVPKDIIENVDEVFDIIEKFTDNDGNIVQYNDENGNVKTALSIISDDGETYYIYFEKGEYFTSNSNVSFSDTENHWAKDSIDFVTSLLLFKGVSDDAFDTEGKMTRAMVATVLYRLVGEPSVDGDISFDDVRAGQWYSDSINWAYDKAIINGMSDELFGTDEDVSREQLITMIYRMLDAYGLLENEMANLDDYSDYNDISDYAVDAFKWAVGAGIINGVTEDSLDPKAPSTRAQVATIFERLVKYILN